MSKCSLQGGNWQQQQLQPANCWGVVWPSADQRALLAIRVEQGPPQRQPMQKGGPHFFW